MSPLELISTYQNVADTEALYCSPQSSGITGHCLVVDVGLSLQEQAGMARTLMSLNHKSITQNLLIQQKTNLEVYQ